MTRGGESLHLHRHLIPTLDGPLPSGGLSHGGKPAQRHDLTPPLRVEEIYISTRMRTGGANLTFINFP
jgi:hypothetical protein